uniref:Calpain-14-like isoform X1 n=1 Tax=Geotrypetes seraphini TaxID=260995 RepID=A0A6P8R7I3_GEOSA|nr:calpain-14-like isoform X1 [Geotrypetes seraphini]
MPRLAFLSGEQKSRKMPIRTGTFKKPRRLLDQNYQVLLETCLRNKKLYVDDVFPATLNSIGTGDLLKKLPPDVQWKRPHELVKNPQFWCENASRFDLRQGLTENCWFLAALASLTFHHDILTNVVPQNQSFDRKYAGIFHFRFWRFGEWVDVVVDDMLPVNKDGQLIFVSSIRKNLFWGALLEKAYAKLCGSYEDTQIGQVSEALVDFTGGVNMSIRLAEAPSELWEIMQRAAYSGSLMGCQTRSGKEQVLENGLVAGHAYTVTGIRKVTCKTGPENLVRLRNPWGRIEWKGAWSDCSVKWEQISLKERILLRRTRDDGEFWMSLEDFKIHFVELVICKLTPDLMSPASGMQWTLSMQTGKWSAGSTAGGRMSYQETFWLNPQYRLKILTGDNMEKSVNSCSVLISLLQKQNHKHRNQSPPLYIGFSIFKVPLEFQDLKSRLPQNFFAKHPPVNTTCIFINEREVSQDFRLMPGAYVIVPSTAEPDQECEFILRVFSRRHVLQEQGGNILCCKTIVDKQEDKIWEKFFNKYFMKHPEINVDQLQLLLNKANWTNVKQVPVKFSLDACKGFMALLDLSATGTLSMQEFRTLWKRLLFFQEVFQKKDIEKTGYLNLNDMQAAVQERGISLSDRFTNLMALRYGDSSMKISFDNFACFMLRVEMMGEVFHNLSKDGKGIYLEEAEWHRPRRSHSGFSYSLRGWQVGAARPCRVRRHNTSKGLKGTPSYLNLVGSQEDSLHASSLQPY